jgi:AraC-like DNA-binding protein
MSINQQTLSHSPLVWEKTLPPGFSGIRLPGSSLLTSVGEFGSLCIQEFKTDFFIIRYYVLHALQRFVMKMTIKEKGIYSQLVLHGGCEQQIKNEELLLLKKNHFVLLRNPLPEIIISFNAPTIYQSFDTFFSSRMITDVVKDYPSLQQALQELLSNKNKILHRPVWADADTLDIAYNILNCQYEKDLRRFFFNSRVRDHFFKYLVQLTQYDPTGDQPSKTEVAAIFQAEQLINNDITKHTHIYELSKKVLLNEFRFKIVFKKILGMGPYEYLVRQRMKKAKELLENGLTVKEVALQTGYRPTDFTSAFINFYGFAPSSVRKKS